MKKYSSYKDSGVKWLGKIPSHWKVNKFRYLFKTRTGITFTKAQLNDNGEPVISYGQIHSKENWGTSVNQELIRHIPFSLTKGKDNALAYSGDFLFADTSEDFEGCGNNVYIDSTPVYAGYHTILAKKNNEEYGPYLAYLFSSNMWRGQLRSMVNGVKVYSITQTILNSVNVVLPPFKEQKKIASFLNSATTRIDKAIAQQQRMIDLLNERKQIIINQAITKGINKNVSLKESGYKWIGMIPSHWKIIKTSFVFTHIGSGTTPNSSREDYYSEDGFPFLQTGDLNNGLIRETSKKLSKKALKSLGLTVYSKGSLAIAMYGATIGKLGILEIDSTVNQACCVLPETNSMDTRYVFYVFSVAKDDLLRKSKGGGQPNISQDVIKNEKIPVPPVEEQTEIANFIESVCKPIEDVIQNAQRLTDYLQERKQIIVNEVVTGKVKVS